MKKTLLLVVLLLVVAFGFTACAPKYELAMVTDAGDIDDKSFNESTWNGVKDYAEANDISYKYYDPIEDSHDGRLAAIELAIKGGAKTVVCPGFLFETVIYDAQSKYPDVNFILLDGSPHDDAYSDFTIESNVYSIFYAEQESGFLAGYAAVKDGYTDLGFMGGMAVPAVVRFGYGFVQGAEYAAEEMGVDGINIKYHYTGNFNDTPEAQTLAASWYADGTEVIFSAGGSVFFSVDAAAQATEDGKIIGVDVDQSYLSDRVITSAKKELTVSVLAALEDVYSDSFKGGTIDVFDIKIDGVGLPMETSQFNTFSQADYDSIFGTLVADSSFILADTDVDAADAIPTQAVTVTVVE